MSSTTIVVLILVVVLAAAAAIVGYRYIRTRHLRTRFGPEYERTVRESGGRKLAEARLETLEKRVSRLQVRALGSDEKERFVSSWRSVQSRFVDDPRNALTEADTLLGQVLSARGYPVGDFEARAGDVSVDHPRVVEHYRAGHEIVVRHGTGLASTEDLRQAMIHYRALFEELVEEPVQAETVRSGRPA